MRQLCIYHGGCTDGVAAAWVVWTANPAYEFYPGVYQEDPPWDLVNDVDKVLLVDFSYKRDVLKEMALRCSEIEVLDHHKTAREDLTPLLENNVIDGVFDMDRCGALIAWNKFFLKTPPPSLLLEIDKHDRWLSDRDPKIIMALRSWPHAPEKESWEELMAKWTFLMSKQGVDRLRADGEAIHRYYRQRIDETKGHERWIRVNGTMIPVINAPFFMASDVAGGLAKKYDDDIGAVWWQNIDGTATFSLRSCGDRDVSVMAKSFGGGGHKNAAGFRLSARKAAILLFDQKECPE